MDEHGNPQNVRILHSIAENEPPKLRSIVTGLDNNAVKAVQQYRFEPATFQGKPVPVEVRIEVNFRIY